MHATPEVIDLAARRRAIRSVLPFIGAALHIGQIGLFVVLGLPGWLSWLSVWSVAVYGVSVALVRVGRPRLGMWAAYFEIITHVTMFTVVFGPGTDYLFYLGPAATSAFLVFGSEDRVHRFACVVIAIVGGPALIAWSMLHPPFFTLSAFQIETLSRVNVFATAVTEVAVIGWFARVSDRADAALATERERAESLLRNVFPASIAQRLKQSPGAIAEATSEVAVLFADIVGFTPMAAQMKPTELVALLDAVFTRFDELADRYGLEKIKTIGDAYLVVGGIPEAHGDPVGAMAKMAIAMREAIRDVAAETSHAIDVRIGVATGPVVAGVIGRRRFAYDLWGDTVNTAARMESHGAPGEIHVTAGVKDALGDRFVLESRGVVSIKGKGDMETFWLKEAR